MSDFKILENKPGTIKSITNLDSYLRASLQEIFSLDNINSSHTDPFKRNFSKAVSQSLNDFETLAKDNTQQQAYKRTNQNQQSDALEQNCILGEQEYFKFLEKKGGVVDRIYDKIRYASELARTYVGENSKGLPDAFFFTRFYNQTKETKRFVKESLRFHGYPYNARFILPESQENEIRIAFNHLKKIIKEKGILYYEEIGGLLYDKLVDSSNDNYQLMRQLDEFFWHTLLYEKKGIDMLINILKTNVGDHARSFTDAVFCNNLVHFRLPFQGGGLYRIFPDYSPKNMKDIDSNDMNDYKRLVIAHYLFEAMAPWKSGRQKESLALILIPIEVGGTVWGVTGHIFYLDDVNSGYLNTVVWDAVYTFYNYVAARVGRNLRRELLHLQSQILFSDKNGLRDLLDEVVLKGEFKGIVRGDMNQSFTYFNENAESVSKYLPYDQVSLSWKLVKRNKHDTEIDLFSDIKIKYKSYKNVYFDISTRKNMESISRRTNSYMFQELERTIRAFENYIRDFCRDKYFPSSSDPSEQ